MSRLESWFLFFVVLAVAGLGVILGADALAASFHPDTATTPAGAADPVARRTFYLVGLVVMAAGAGGMVVSGRRWLAAGGSRELGR